MSEILKKLPQVNELLNDEALVEFATFPHSLVVSSIREVLANYREEILSGNKTDVDKAEIVNSICEKIIDKNSLSLKKVINATGTVLHTNLGRAVISKSASLAMTEVAKNYTNLEYDLQCGERGNRQTHIEKMITELTGSEAALVVNNNAAATIIVLATLARNKEVIISRGELIEIGDSFRLPLVMKESGAIIHEVGTTNKTKLNDYKNAFDSETTAAIVKVHTSNYRIVGFTESTSVRDLVAFANEVNVPVIYDMGNGLLIDLNEHGIDEPTITELVKTNADIILFSGDKLLGGPQAGIIIGKKKYIDQMKKHPLARALRVDKFTIAALGATLLEYYDTENAKKNIPILNMITMSKMELDAKAKHIKDLLESRIKVCKKNLSQKQNLSNDKFFTSDSSLVNDTLPTNATSLANDITFSLEDVKDQVGGGTAPNTYLEGTAISLTVKNIEVEEIEKRLRHLKVPIIARISHDKILFDVRTILDDDIETFINEVIEIL